MWCLNGFREGGSCNDWRDRSMVGEYNGVDRAKSERLKDEVSGGVLS